MKISEGETVKWGRMHVRLLSDVECYPVEAHREAGEKSWSMKSVTEKRAHIEKMVQARKVKREQAKLVLAAYEEGFQIQRLGEIRKEKAVHYNEAVSIYTKERESRDAEIEEFTSHINPVPDPPSTVDESKTIEDSRKLLGQILTESSIQRRTEKEAKPEPALMKALTTLLPKAAKPQTEEEWAALDWDLTDKDLSKLTGFSPQIVQATRKQLTEMGRI